jgi:hypothetical protein
MASKAWQVVVAVGALLGLLPTESGAAEWSSRSGPCYQWAGRWSVEQEASGVWVGHVDYLHTGGSCEAPTDTAISYPVRAVIVGKDFYAYRTSGAHLCHSYGQVRAEGVSGYELCIGAQTPHPFALRLVPEDGPSRR